MAQTTPSSPRGAGAFRPLADVGVLEQGVLEQGPPGRGPGLGLPVVGGPALDSAAGDNSLPLLVINSFTWPNPPVTFAYEAERSDCGSDLRKNLAALVGYLELDVAVYDARSGRELSEQALGAQGLGPGDSVRLMRRSNFAPRDAGRSTPPIAPSSASLERFHDSVYTVHCLEQHPRAPVLLRMLQLSHGALPPAAGEAGGAHAPEFDPLLAAIPRPGGAADAMAVGSEDLLDAAGLGVTATADGAGALCALDELFDSFGDWEAPATHAGAACAAGGHEQATEAPAAACDAEKRARGDQRMDRAMRRRMDDLASGAMSDEASNADSATPSTEEASELSYSAVSPSCDRPGARLAAPAVAKTRSAAMA